MLPVGIGLVAIGYAMLFSGVSNLVTGGKGWGFFQSLGYKKGKNTGINVASYISDITLPGDTGSTAPSVTPAVQPPSGTQATPPVAETLQV